MTVNQKDGNQQEEGNQKRLSTFGANRRKEIKSVFQHLEQLARPVVHHIQLTRSLPLFIRMNLAIKKDDHVLYFKSFDLIC
jgi:hypothetical protein